MDDEYKGEDRKGRVTYDKFKDVKKALKGPEYKNLLQQFMEMIKTPTTTVAPGRPRKAIAKKVAVRNRTSIPKSPTR
jgi:hypothetical protein